MANKQILLTCIKETQTNKMNTNLLYAKASYMGFVNNDEWMDNSLATFRDTKPMSKDELFAMANQCRKGVTPVFADESKFLQTNTVSGDAGAVVVAAVPIMATQSTSTHQEEPHNQSQTQSLQSEISRLSSQLTPNEKMLLEGIGIGIGIMVLFKMLA
jgi:hypothetical protein